MNSLKNFLSEIQSQVETVTEKDGILILRVKQDVMSDPDQAIPFIQLVNRLKQNLRLDPYVKFTMKTKQVQDGENVSDNFAGEAVEYQIDLIGLHAEGLRNFFQKDITKVDAVESIAYLASHGWSEDQLQKEFSVSKATLYRYQAEKKATEGPTSDEPRRRYVD
jgi:hypothetical protein